MYEKSVYNRINCLHFNLIFFLNITALDMVHFQQCVVLTIFKIVVCAPECLSLRDIIFILFFYCGIL